MFFRKTTQQFDQSSPYCPAPFQTRSQGGSQACSQTCGRRANTWQQWQLLSMFRSSGSSVLAKKGVTYGACFSDRNAHHNIRLHTHCCQMLKVPVGPQGVGTALLCVVQPSSHVHQRPVPNGIVGIFLRILAEMTRSLFLCFGRHTVDEEQQIAYDELFNESLSNLYTLLQNRSCTLVSATACNDEARLFTCLCHTISPNLSTCTEWGTRSPQRVSIRVSSRGAPFNSRVEPGVNGKKNCCRRQPNGQAVIAFPRGPEIHQSGQQNTNNESMEMCAGGGGGGLFRVPSGVIRCMLSDASACVQQRLAPCVIVPSHALGPLSTADARDECKITIVG